MFIRPRLRLGLAWFGGAVALAITTLLGTGPGLRAAQATRVQFVFTSDSHYGLSRANFRGATGVDAHVVNAALVAAMNQVQAAHFPKDGGIGSTEAVGPVDFVVDAGDIASREEQTDTASVQPAAVSWAQFEADYLRGLLLTDASGERAPFFVVPGNHDLSNAIGYFRPMTPARDGTALAAIFNLMMQPAMPRTAATIAFPKDRIDTSRDIGGLHLVFFTLWPDSPQRAWLDANLAPVPASVPVILFAHDQPDAEAKQFTNPNGAHDINSQDAFENILVDQLADGPTTAAGDVIEQRALEATLRRHANIAAYFHGNSNWNQFYDWTGPDHTIALHTFRVDSPIKGAISATDETKLSFQIATVDLVSRTMTVRECLWNTQPLASPVPLAWGGSTTVAFGPR